MESNTISIPDGEIAKGISQFLTESGAIITPETSTAIEQEIRTKLKDKIDNNTLTKPELHMTIMESVMPLSPDSETKTSSLIHSTTNTITSVLDAIRGFVISAKGGVPLERLRLSAKHVNDLIQEGKIKVTRNVEVAKEKIKEIDNLKTEASQLLDQLDSPNILAPEADKRFVTLKNLIDCKNQLQEGLDGTSEEENEEEIPEEQTTNKIMLNGQVISRASISKSWAVERKTRQRIALKYYLLKAQIATTKGVLAGLIKTKTIFDKIPTIEIERGERNPSYFSQTMIGDYIENKMPLWTESLAEQAEELKESMKHISELFNYSSLTSQTDIPINKLIDSMPASDWAEKNFVKLMDLEEIYQHWGQKTKTQQTNPKISLDKNTINYDDFTKAFPGIDLAKYINPEQKKKLEGLFENINKEAGMTWKKGMSIAMFSQPQLPATERMMSEQTLENGEFGQTTLSGESVDVNRPKELEQLENLKSEARKIKEAIKNHKSNKKRMKAGTDKLKALDAKIEELEKTKTKLNEEITKLSEQIGDVNKSKGYEQAGKTPGRGLFEINRENPSWMVLLSSIRPRHVNRQLMDQDMEIINKFDDVVNVLGENIQSQETKKRLNTQVKKIRSTMEGILGVPGVKQINNKENVISAIDNPKTPSWILMRAVQFPYDKQTSDLAEYNLEQRGWIPKTDASGNFEENQGDIVWQKKEKTKKKANISIREAEIKKSLQYENKFFAQGYDANEYIEIIDNKGPSTLIGYLISAGAFENEGEMSDKPHHGRNDHIRKFKDGYIVSWNYRIPYVGVEVVHEGNNPDAWVSPEEQEASEKMKEHNRILGASAKISIREAQMPTPVTTPQDADAQIALNNKQKTDIDAKNNLLQQQKMKSQTNQAQNNSDGSAPQISNGGVKTFSSVSLRG